MRACRPEIVSDRWKTAVLHTFAIPFLRPLAAPRCLLKTCVGSSERGVLYDATCQPHIPVVDEA